MIIVLLLALLILIWFGVIVLKHRKEINARVSNASSTAVVNKDTNLTPEEKEDLILEEMSMRYKNYTTTKEKATRMCSDEIATLQAQLDHIKLSEKSMMNAGDSFYRSTKEKEHSWALHGGIASGIAGGAAGVATALRVQEENRAIRERNQALAGNIAQVQVNAILHNADVVRKLEKELAFWAQQRSLSQGKKNIDLPVETLMKELHLSVVRREIKRNGTIILGIALGATQSLYVGNTPAVIDGTIRLVLKRCGIYLGEAFLSLPHDGSRNSHSELVTICRNPTERCFPSEIEVEFEPYHLWAVATAHATASTPPNRETLTDSEKKERIYECLKKRGKATIPELTNIVANRYRDMNLTYNSKSSQETIKRYLRTLEKEGRVSALDYLGMLHYKAKE